MVHGTTELAVAASFQDEAVGDFPASDASDFSYFVVLDGDYLGVRPSVYRYVAKALAAYFIPLRHDVTLRTVTNSFSSASLIPETAVAILSSEMEEIVYCFNPEFVRENSLVALENS